MTIWQRWRDHPEQSRLRQITFQVHLWIGAAVGAYVLVMSISGSMIVFRNEVSPQLSLEWVVRLHESVLAGSAGHALNGIGATSLISLALTGAIIWWPAARFPRLNWDVHSAFGIWFLPFVVIWGVSGLYLAQPQLFNILLRLDPADRVVDRGLFWLTQLHFGRFNRATEVLWALLGLVPAILAFTGVFICCRRVILNRPSNPKNATD